jgi:hypothetical protein
MEQSFEKILSQNREILCILQYIKTHYSANYSQKMIPFLSHINPAYNLPFYFYEIRLNNIVSAKPISLK